MFQVGSTAEAERIKAKPTPRPNTRSAGTSLVSPFRNEDAEKGALWNKEGTPSRKRLDAPDFTPAIVKKQRQSPLDLRQPSFR